MSNENEGELFPSIFPQQTTKKKVNVFLEDKT